MGVKERRERQKQETQEGILAAAREIAREASIAPPIIYEYFASKDAILGDLQCIGFDLLTDTMWASGEGVPDPAERTVQMGWAYWRFAHESPELFQVMHGWDSAALPMENTLVGARKSAAVVWAHQEGRARVALGRAAGFFGLRVFNSSLRDRVSPPALPGRRLRWSAVRACRTPSAT